MKLDTDELLEIFVGFADQMNKKSSNTIEIVNKGFVTIDKLIRQLNKTATIKNSETRV